MLTLDTSALLALLDRKERHHQEVKGALLDDGGPYFCPVGILAEVAYMVEVRLGTQALEVFLDDLLEGAYALAPVEGDLPRIIELLGRYADLPLGFSDACVVACAEGHGGELLSLDKHFAMVAREGCCTYCCLKPTEIAEERLAVPPTRAKTSVRSETATRTFGRNLHFRSATAQASSTP